MSLLPLLTANNKTYFAVPYRTLTQQLTPAPMLLLLHPDNGLSAEFPSPDFETRVTTYNARIDWETLFNRVFETLKNWLGEEASKRLASSEVEVRKIVDLVNAYLAGSRPYINELAGFIVIKGYHFTFVTYQGGLVGGSTTRVTIKPLEDRTAFLASAVKVPIPVFLQDLRELHDRFGSINIVELKNRKMLKQVVSASRGDIQELVNYLCSLCEITPYGFATFVIFANEDYTKTVFADVRRLVEAPDLSNIRQVIAYGSGSTAILVIVLEDFDPSRVRLVPKDLLDKLASGQAPRLTALKKLVAYKVFGRVRTRTYAETIKAQVAEYLGEEEEEETETETSEEEVEEKKTETKPEEKPEETSKEAEEEAETETTTTEAQSESAEVQVEAKTEARSDRSERKARASTATSGGDTPITQAGKFKIS